MAKFNPLALALLIATASTGCASLAPAVPDAQPQVRGTWVLPERSTSGDITSVGWRDMLLEPRLERVVEQALANNRDLRVAVLNVERARAQYRITRADRVPAIGGNATLQRSGGDAGVSESYSASVGMSSFELDLFGRVRSLSDAALQQFFAQQENSRAVQISLIGEITTAWMTLAADQSLTAVAEQTLATYDESLRLTERRHELGAVSGLELAQARTQVETARGDLARYRGQVEQDRHALDLLVGAPVAEADLPSAFTDDLVAMPPMPAGTPSELLLQRPDIRAAEYSLRAANANIGAARAAFFPSISLTGSAGSMSGDFSGLFNAGTRFWQFVPQINVPIFQGGALRANLGMANADRDIALAQYEKAIQSGFRDVADALTQTTALSERRAAAERMLDAARQSERLSQARRDAGRDSYLTLLDAQRTRYSAEQAVISLRLAEQVNRIGLYQAMGGGWEQPVSP